MTSRILNWLAAICLVLPLGAQAQGSAPESGLDDDAEVQREYWDDMNRGWFFYERKPQRAKSKPVMPALAPQTAEPAPSSPAKHPDLVRFDDLQKRVETTRNIAIINPTEENLRSFLETQQEALDLSANFAFRSERVVWATPTLDPSTRGEARPTSAAGMYMYDEEQRRRLARKWAELKETHAFFYFYRSDCPYCAQFSPTLRYFSDRTGITVLAISMDGGSIAEFPDAMPDNGIAASLGVEQVPALYMAQPSSGRVLPVGYGVISPVDLERRVDLVTRPDAEQAVPSTLRHLSASQLLK